MRSMDDACKEVLRYSGDALACGVLDLDQKKVLEVRILPSFSAKQTVAISDAIINLLRGKGTDQLSEIAHDASGISRKEASTFHEILVTFGENLYFINRIKNGKAAVFLVTKKTGNIGMAWVKLKSLTSILEPLIAP